MWERGSVGAWERGSVGTWVGTWECGHVGILGEAV